MNSNRRLSLSALLLTHVFFLLPHSTQAGHRPVQYKIGGKQTECIYEHLIPTDVATFSVFVIEALQNGKPKASITFDGPVAGIKLVIQGGHNSNSNNNNNEDESSTLESEWPPLESAGQRGKQTIGRDIRQSILTEWPKINGDHAPNGVVQRRFKVDWTHAGESEDDVMARSQILEKTHEEFRQHKLENVNVEDGQALKTPLPMHTIAQKSIHPYEETHDIELDGWYRLCVKSDFFPLLVEMDIRIANKLMGINPGTGHVYTYELREYIDEQNEMFGKEKEDESIKNEDFAKSNKILKYMHELTSKIMKSQHDRSHRIRAHDADARRGAAELAWSSKFETFLYVVITGVQVYSVRKWLLGNNLLGK
mmetsp:Transcript_6365/g.14376  ORF Transcript_6365/g.14376 Transcript_6365/m.14376 type:complete len:366 (-) Transcript_6365:422-1519(-)|eukprot:CAMPEP_0172316062 /NCGR_PEP_ID=MMETSP1058-20130122/27118_1 /TAXON_ID=83371 /ORGANISM="Detonula confervacea, Strain CCMP 353" /LENGTH=365 /DNA_ID=CAMNT_0013030289 /DNA_START=35 /DNA_END=1132 /DNA_ORIENTATION=-